MTTLPNFFILGAAKSGTTTLVDILRQHPQAYLPFDKEPMFFSRDTFYREGLEWYCRTFFQGAGAFSARGEATPHYLYWAEKVAPRIMNMPAEKPPHFIIILRNPADRAYSWYWNMVREGLEDLSFEQALAEEPERLQKNVEELRSTGSMQYGYTRGGHYAEQIAHFLEFFERTRFLFLLQDDLLSDFGGVCRQMFHFLEIDEGVAIQVSASNPASMPRSRWLQKVLQGPSGAKELLKRVLPRRMRYRAKRGLLNANAVITRYPPMPADIRRMLQNLFRDENQKLSKMIQRDLSHWERA
jgi:hypothetical protein